MYSTITVGEGLVILIGLAIFVLIVYLILLVRSCIPAVKQANRILNDVNIVSGIVSDATCEVRDSVDSIVSTAAEVSDVVEGSRNLLTATASLVNASVALKNHFSS